MTLVQKQDVKIKVNFTSRNGEQDFVTLEEFDSASSIQELGQISKRVTLQDTADVIFRMFAKAANNEADLSEVSEKLPCIKGKNLEVFTDVFNRPEIASALKEYNTTTDKNVKREIRSRVSKILVPEIEKNVAYEDLYFNFSKFKFMHTDASNSLKQKFMEAGIKAEALLFGIDKKDKYAMAVLQMYKENVSKRTENTRKAYWLLIKDSKGKLVGMTFISATELKDNLIGKNIIGHSGQILDPSVQGRGYVSAIKSAMVDFMYDNLDEKTAKESLFATTCNELNENSQGLQYKSGAKPLLDKDGQVLVEAGKIHWYATKDDIMNSDIMRQCIERKVSYEVMPVVATQGRFPYRKFVGQKNRMMLMKEETYER